MANLTLQLVIPINGVGNLSQALPQPTGGAGNVVGQPPVGNLYVQWLTIQNNSAHNIRYGTTKSVSTTIPAAVNGGTAGYGILLTPGGAGSQSTPITYATYLSDWWISGTVGDVIDILALQ
jgi:hypothetical protein